MYALASTRNLFREPSLFDLSFEEQNFVPAVDFSEDEKTFCLSFDLPGMKREDASVELKDGVLTVAGKRESDRREGGFSEKCYGSFRRSFTLPKSIDSEAVTAKFKDGVLDISVAKREEIQAKTIEIV